MIFQVLSTPKVDTQSKYLGNVVNSREDNTAIIKDMLEKLKVLQMKLFLSVKKSTLAKIKSLTCYCYMDHYSFLGLSVTVKHGQTLPEQTMAP